VTGAVAVVACAVIASTEGEQAEAERRRPASTADHTKFEELQVDFATGPEVTAACLECHTEAAQQVMQTSHWTWICPRARQELAERQGRAVGKGEHVINNFCIALGSNEPRCTSCHAGYGWEDKTFDFNNETLVDCLVCHDTTGEYRKFPTGAGHPNYEPKEWPKGSGNVWQPPDLTHVAMNVGRPSRRTCGTCHFFGGGGEGVKHGDMDVTLADPDPELDVHMTAELDFDCVECHTTREHQVAGRCFTIPAVEQRQFVIRGMPGENNLLACESCHTAEPHASSKVNDHSDKVSCQACHIPTLARQRPTKMWWDWSKAGQMGEDGKPRTETAEVKGDKVKTYDTKKGQFIWAKDEPPEYRWFNGRVSHTFIGDRVDDQTPGRESGCRAPGEFDRIDLDKPVVRINTLHGDYHDPNARIWPVKVHRGVQPYDTKNKTLAVPKLFGPKGSGAYWAEYDWQKSIATGMAYVGEDYSGEFGWIQTQMYWPLAHMVAPKEHALQCVQCHHPEGRLAALGGFYMPGRDRNVLLDTLGLLMIGGTIVGSLSHGILRIVLRPRNDKAVNA
jgi:octaheme c-type cytochrome (tetrathionate reductase family)